MKLAKSIPVNSIREDGGNAREGHVFPANLVPLHLIPDPKRELRMATT